jgi:hypothetical protein
MGRVGLLSRVHELNDPAEKPKDTSKVNPR